MITAGKYAHTRVIAASLLLGVAIALGACVASSGSVDAGASVLASHSLGGGGVTPYNLRME